MENGEMGRVVVTALVENAGDLWNVQKGICKPEDVHRVEVTDALVDTGAYSLSMPKRLIQQLGFTTPTGKRHVKTASGFEDFDFYGPVRLTIQGRFCSTDVTELPDHCPMLIGQIPLEALDWVVDLKGGKLIGNPEHDGKFMWEIF